MEERDDPKIIKPTDAVVRLSATCVCGSDLWPYRGLDAVQGPSPMGHEYAGIVQQVGSQVERIRPGQFVIGSFFACDNTCELCQAGYQSSCLHREPIDARGPRFRRQRRRQPARRGRVARVKELTGGLGAHSVVEAVGTQESMLRAIRSTRPGGHVGYVGVAT